MAKKRTTSDARTRIVEAADRLFYADGIRAVGIDRIIAEAGVAKMSLYNNFASKDDLVLAVLKFRDEKIGRFFESAMQRYVDDGSDRLNAFFSALKEWFESKGFRGCAFINAVVELADPSHPGAAFSAQHKQLFREMIGTIMSEAHGEASVAFVPAVSLMIEGAIVTAVMDGNSKAADVARDAALSLINSLSKKRK
ncbi:TetR family transcriptional regulator [bacterium]|nr:TetR family transcriptional regulator [bacterium]